MSIKLLTPKYFTLNCRFIVPEISYEHYLVEVVNGSRFFRSKCHHMEQYQLEEEQSHGENDVVSSIYCMDFKLLVDQTVMSSMSKNRPEVDYSKMHQGLIFVKTKDHVKKPKLSNILLQIMDVQKEDIHACTVNNTIMNLLKNLKKEKNLFIYYPYEFSSDTDMDPAIFAKLLTDTLRAVMEYREKVCPNRDTYMCIKANKWFLIYEWEKEQFIFRDKVHEILCSNYIDVRLYSVY